MVHEDLIVSYWLKPALGNHCQTGLSLATTVAVSTMKICLSFSRERSLIVARNSQDLREQIISRNRLLVHIYIDNK